MPLKDELTAAFRRVAAEFNAAPPPSGGGGAISVASSMPPSPSAGQAVIRSDLSYELFVFDPIRNAWLTPSRRSVVFSANNSSSVLWLGDTQQFDAKRVGFSPPFDMTVTRWSARNRFKDSGSLQIFADELTVGEQVWNTVDKFESGENLNIPLSAGQVVTMRIIGSTSGGWTSHVSIIEYARRINP